MYLSVYAQLRCVWRGRGGEGPLLDGGLILRGPHCPETGILGGLCHTLALSLQLSDFRHGLSCLMALMLVPWPLENGSSFQGS